MPIRTMPPDAEHPSLRQRIRRAVALFVGGLTLSAALPLLGSGFQYAGALLAVAAALFVTWPLISDLRTRKSLDLEHYFEGGLAVALIIFAVILVFVWHPSTEPQNIQNAIASGGGSVGINNGNVTNNFAPRLPAPPKVIASIKLECFSGFASTTVPPSQRIYALPLDLVNFRHLIPNPLVSLDQLFTKAAVGSEWNYEVDPFRQAYQCVITNYNTEPLVEAELDIPVSFEAVVRPIPSGSAQSGATIFQTTIRLQVPTVEAGAANPFSFHVFSYSDDAFASFALPKVIVGRLLSEAKPHQFQLIDLHELSRFTIPPKLSAPAK